MAKTLQDFKLDFHDVEYILVKKLGRELTEKESSYLFLNFLRRKLGLSFQMSSPVFTESTVDIPRYVYKNKI